MNPYEVLGVPRDADAATIKAAFRRRSSAAHPDRMGGSHAAQAQVNEAWAILGDPERRALFDQEGRTDAIAHPDAPAREMLLQVLAAALEQEEMPVIARARAQIQFVEIDLLQKIDACEARQAKLRKRRATVRSSDAMNLVHGLIDQQIEREAVSIDVLESNLTIIRRAGELLEGYADEIQQPTFRPIMETGTWTGISLDLMP